MNYNYQSAGIPDVVYDMQGGDSQDQSIGTPMNPPSVIQFAKDNEREVIKDIMNARKSNLGSIVSRRKEVDKMPYRGKS